MNLLMTQSASLGNVTNILEISEVLQIKKNYEIDYPEMIEIIITGKMNTIK